MPFNRLMTEFFESRDIEELVQRMFAHIKTQVENPHINFPKLALTRESSYMDSLEESRD